MLLLLLGLVELDKILETLRDDISFLSGDGDKEELGGAFGAAAGDG